MDEGWKCEVLHSRWPRLNGRKGEVEKPKSGLLRPEQSRPAGQQYAADSWRSNLELKVKLHAAKTSVVGQ